jgi:mannose-6-phosphate isomerase
MVWGGRRLADTLGKSLPSHEQYGESWEISDHALHHSVVADGPLKGRSLRDLMMTERAALLGPRATQPTFPLLVKFLDACDRLSVQVHPDDDKAVQLCPGEGGKTEAWFVLDAAPGSRIYAGLKPGVGERELHAALSAGTVGECLHQFEPQAGDCLFLPAGTVHAVGGGVLMAEVQQTSDATFRLFDWNRRDAQGKTRPLHIEQGLASIGWDYGPVNPVRVPWREASRHRQSLIRCPFFDLEFVLDREPFTVGGSGLAHIVSVLSGSGRLGWPAGETSLTIGQTWLLPAAMSAVEVLPHSDLATLIVTIPSLH